MEGSVGTSNNLQDVIWNYLATTPYWIAVGASGTLITSTDGSAWTTNSTGLSNTLVGVAVGDMGQGQRIVIIDSQGDGAWSANDGSNWTAFTTGTGVTTTECYWTGYTFNILQNTGTPGTNAVSTYYCAISNAWTAIPSTQIQFGATGTVRPRDVVWVTADNQFVLVVDQNGLVLMVLSSFLLVVLLGQERTDANIPNESFLKVVYNASSSEYFFLTADKLHKTARRNIVRYLD